MKLLRSRAMRHALAISVALWAMAMLVRYRPLGWSVAAYIPWLGSAIVLLNVLFLVSRSHAVDVAEDGIDAVMARLERGASLAVIVFTFWAVFVTFNAALDRSRPFLVRAEVVELGGRTLSGGVPWIYSQATLRARSPISSERLTLVLGPDEQRRFFVGESVVLRIRDGRFGLRWVASVERDDEVYYRQLLVLSPDAIQPWKDLVRFLFNHGFWVEALAESRRYTEAHPDDADFVYYAGENLSLRGFDADAVWFLARAVELQPSRYHSYRLAWALTRRDDASRAIETLEAARARYPEAWEFPFLLAYHYMKTGAHVRATAALERVETLRPGVPEVAAVLARLRARDHR